MVERAYEARITLRFRVEGEDAPACDALAERFAWGVSSWMDASGIPPWTTSMMVTGTEVEHRDADASTEGLRVITEETLDDPLGH